MRQEVTQPNVTHYSCLLLWVLRKTMKNLSEDSRCPRQDSNQTAHTAEATPPEPICNVLVLLVVCFKFNVYAEYITI